MRKRRWNYKILVLISVFALLIVSIGHIPNIHALPSDLRMISDMEEGWSRLYFLGDFQYDFRDSAEGKGSLELIPDNVDGFTGVKASYYPMNLKYNGIRLFIKSNDWDLVYTLVISFHTYYDWDDYFIYEISWNLIEKPDDEWIEVVLSPSEFVKIGNPTWQSISMVTFRTDVNPGKGCRVKVDGLCSFFSFNRSAVSIVFDDGQLSTLRAKQVMDEFGVAGSLFVIPNYLYEPDFLNQEMIDRFHHDGWDIGGHGDLVLTGLSPEELHTEFQTAQTYLESHQYRGKDIYALPYGVYNQQVIEIGKHYFNWIRPSDNLHQPNGYIAPYRINTRTVSMYTSVDMVKSWIDKAKEYDDWLILIFHRIEDEQVYDTDYPEASFRDIIQYCVDNDLDILPMSEYLKDFR